MKKKHHQITDKTTDLTFKLINLNRKENTQQRNQLLPYHTKRYDLRKITQFHSFIGLQIVESTSDINNQKK